MKVILAEKPSVAREIAGILNATEKKSGYLTGNGYAVTWAFGHLVTLLDPHEYDPALKRWSLNTLPFIPTNFRLKLSENRGVAEQFAVIQDLFTNAESIICATDAGREGELIFRYILSLCNCEDKPFQRLWLSSLTEGAIKDAFGRLKDGHDYDRLYAAARCRSESDWIVGLNGTRYFSVRYGRIGNSDGDRVLWSVGRVQTPVLAMIVQRDDAIMQFRAQPFWELATKYRDTQFKYSGDRFDTPAKAQQVLEQITGEPFSIITVTAKKKVEQPPQLFDLTTLQRELNKSHGFSAAETLDAAQKLYEAKFITYPRTDSRYLGSDQKKEVPQIFSHLKALPLRAEQIEPLDLSKLPFTKRIIDDKKVTDHHAIIPTGTAPRGLGATEQSVFDAVTTQFIAAFYPVCTKKLTTIDGLSNSIPFQAKGTQLITAGWSVLFPQKGKNTGDDETNDEQTLPAFKKGEQGPHEPSIREGKTKPPNYFTENSLLGAMEAAGKLVDDDTLREALKERGIGTPATRAAIIETLLRRNYIYREKKQLRTTDMGRCLIALIHDPLLKSPELTGEWENRLKQIERGEYDADSFMHEITVYTQSLINVQSKPLLDVSRLGTCPLCGKEVIQGRSAYGCSDWKAGCPFVLTAEYKNIHLTLNQIQVLLQMRILPYSVQIENETRLLLLSQQGFLMDIAPPASAKQK